MNNTVSSRAELIACCKEIVAEKGIEAVSIREVAKRSHISVGAVYNYFPTKGQLLAATIGSIWSEIFHFSEESYDFDDFVACLEALFQSVAIGKKHYPHFFTSHALVLAFDDKIMGQKMMDHYWQHIKESLRQTLAKDQKIRPNLFNEELTVEKYVDYIFELFLYGITHEEKTAGIVQLVKNSLY
ncbi:hypothetical protein IGI65_000368 [Enterococcus sp. DIV0755b]|uniref:TetR/AcrR family transcriptional regulator n=1 Tax=Enterococcus sp. DIV0755b TaxID=2774657 RepID=UPI003F1FAC76